MMIVLAHHETVVDLATFLVVGGGSLVATATWRLRRAVDGVRGRRSRTPSR